MDIADMTWQIQSSKNDVMNIVQMLSRDVTDKQRRHFVLISIEVPKKSQDVRTPPPLKPTNMLTLPSQQ